jgi:hypothetical protein
MNGTTAPQATKKTSFVPQDKPAAPATKPADAPAAKPADAPAAPAAPAAPRQPVVRPPASLGPVAQKVFPETPSEGFASVDDLVKFLPTLRTDPEAGQRLMKAMHASNDGSKVLLRVMRGMFADMQPMIGATVTTFHQPVGGMFNLPKSAEGGAFSAEKVEDATATVVYKDKDGKQVGNPVPLAKVDGQWYIDFDKAAGGAGDSGAQTAMMADMMGQAMRDAVKSAAKATAEEISAGKYKSPNEAQMAFSRAMQMEMAKSLGMGPGGPGGGPGAGAPVGGAANGGAPKGAAPGGTTTNGGSPKGAAPTPPAGANGGAPKAP